MALFITGFVVAILLEVFLSRFWWKGDKKEVESGAVVMSAEEVEHCEEERAKLKSSVLDKEREISHLHARVAMLEEETDRVARAQAAASKVESVDTKEVPVAEAKKASKPAPKAKAATKKTAKSDAPKAEKKPASKPKTVSKKKAATPKKASKTSPSEGGDQLRQIAKIKAVGPKLAEILAGSGFDSVEKIVSATPPELSAALQKAGGRYAKIDPSTWSEQGKLILAGDTAALKKLQATIG